MSRFASTTTTVDPVNPMDGTVWSRWPEFTVTLEGTVSGPVRVAATSGEHVHVSYTYDNAENVTFRGKDYSPSVHLWAEADWQPRPDRRDDVHMTVKGQYGKDASVFARDAIVAAIVTTVRAYLAEHPEILAEAAVINANNDLKNARDEAQAAREVYDAARAAERKAHQDLLNAKAAQVRAR